MVPQELPFIMAIATAHGGLTAEPPCLGPCRISLARSLEASEAAVLAGSQLPKPV